MLAPSSVGGEDIADDLVESLLVGDECPVDFGHSAGRGWIGVPGVPELVGGDAGPDEARARSVAV